MKTLKIKAMKKNPFGGSKLPQEENSVRYSDEKLSMFKENLLRCLERAKKEEKEIKERKDSHCSSREPGDDDKNIYGIALAEIEHEERRNAEFQKNINKSLALVEQKKYGICRDTGILIPEARLLVAPLATLCCEAKILRDK